MPPNKIYWFPAKRYGWGWGPPRVWQGWAVLIAFVTGVPVGIIRIGPGHVAKVLVFVGVMSLLLVAICYLKGEPPGWRWGDPRP